MLGGEGDRAAAAGAATAGVGAALQTCSAEECVSTVNPASLSRLRELSEVASRGANCDASGVNNRLKFCALVLKDGTASAYVPVLSTCVEKSGSPRT